MDDSARRRDGAALEALLGELESCPPDRRIDRRNFVIAFGAACIEPLADLARRNPSFAKTVAAWLEVLVRNDRETMPAAVKVLRGLTHGPDGDIAAAALARLGEPLGTMRGRKTGDRPKVRSTAEAEVHARIVQAAREGRILVYGDLETSRGHVGRYLFNIARAEAEQGHPPMTAIVVSKSTGLPGDGFLPAMEEIGYAHRGEPMDAVWGRAVTDVHAFWRMADDEGSRP